jgi:protein-tyrosine phosphatase
MKPKILFVCLGNICRSPTAEGVFRGLAAQNDLDVIVDSCGTSGFHNGEQPDTRAMFEASLRGFNLSAQRSTQLKPADFAEFDYIICMDQSNLQNVKSAAPQNASAKIHLFLDYAPDQPLREVPDPYYEDNFSDVFDLIEQASMGLIDHIRNNA